MLGLFKRLFGKAPELVSKEQKEQLDKLGAAQAGEAAKADVASKIRGREKGNFCTKGHAILAGQREADCFDCYLLGMMREEQAGQPPAYAEKTMVGTLLCLNGFHRGHAWSLVMAEDINLVVGAEPDCDIVLSDERISRRHLSMVRRQGRTTVRDLNSLHHSAMRAEGELQWYVLDPEREYWFRDGAHLMLGDVEFLFRASDEQALKVAAAAG